MTNRTKRLYGSVEAARYLGVSRATLHRLASSGEISPATQTPSGYRRFALDELQRFAATRLHIVGPERHTDELTQVVVRQQALLKLGDQIARAQTIEGICSAALETACEVLLVSDVASVLLYDPDTASLRRCMGIGIRSEVGDNPYAVDGESVPARVFQSGRPIVCEDILQISVPASTLQHAQQAGVRAFAAVPIQGPRRVEGVLNLLGRHPASFTTADLSFLSAVADAVARGLDFTAQRKRFECVCDAIASMSLDFERGASFETVAQTATNCVASFDDIQVALSFRLDRQERLLHCVAATGPDELHPSIVPPVPLTEGHIEESLDQRTGNLFDNIQAHPLASESAKEISRRCNLSTWYVFPLLGPHRMVGTLALGSRTSTRIPRGTLQSAAVVARYLATIFTQ